MSTPQPPRRRRIAGESKPGTPAPKTSVVKKAAKLRPTKKPQAPKAPTQKIETPKPPVAESPSRVESGSEPTEFRRKIQIGTLTSMGTIAMVVVTLAALVFGAVFGVKGWNDWRDSSGIVEAHEKAATTAASAGETIFTYQYNQLDDHLRDSKATMTPSFGKKFESIAPALRNLAPQRKIQVKATVRNAAAIDCGNTCRSDRATILVFIDQARVADGAKEPTVFGNRIELMMVKQDGRWLVNNIKAL